MCLETFLLKLKKLQLFTKKTYSTVHATKGKHFFAYRVYKGIKYLPQTCIS